VDDVSGLDQTPAPEGTLAQNILHFARALRAAGLPVGPGAVLDAVRARGVGTIDMPVTQPKLWMALQAAREKSA